METDASFFSPVYLVVGGGCTAFPLSEPRMYQCPHCPNEPPYAGASGLWYHMKRHHGAVTRPYNKSKAGAGGKPRTPKKKKDKASKKVKNNHHHVGQGGSMYDPPLTPGGRSKFPVSPRFKHVHHRRDTEEEEDSEDDYDSDESMDNGGLGGGAHHPCRSGPLYMGHGGTTVMASMSSNGLVRPSLLSLNSSTMQLDDLRSVVALKSLNASPAVSGLRKQLREGMAGISSSSSSSSSSLSHDASSSEMMLLSEVALLLGASKNMNDHHSSNNPTTVVLKTTTTTATTTTTEVSMDNDDHHGKNTGTTAAQARVVAAVAVDVNATVHQHSIGGGKVLTRNSSNASTVDGSALGKTPKKGGLDNNMSSSSSSSSAGGLSPATQKSPMPLSLDKNKMISRALDMEDLQDEGGQGKGGRSVAFPNLVL